MKRYWPHIVKSTEKTVEDYLAKQVKDASRPDDGRMPSEIVEGKLTIYLLTDAVCLYFCKESKYYKDEKLFEAIKRGLSFIDRGMTEVWIIRAAIFIPRLIHPSASADCTAHGTSWESMRKRKRRRSCRTDIWF